MLIEAYTYIYTHKNIRINTYTHIHIMCIYGLRGLTRRHTCEIRAAAGAKSCKSSPLVRPPLYRPFRASQLLVGRPQKPFAPPYHPLTTQIPPPPVPSAGTLPLYMHVYIYSSCCGYIYVWMFIHIYIYLNKCSTDARAHQSSRFRNHLKAATRYSICGVRRVYICPAADYLSPHLHDGGVCVIRVEAQYILSPSPDDNII